MLLKTERYKAGETMPHTPASALTAGKPVQVGGRVGIPQSNIAATKTDDVDVTGIFAAVFAACVGNIGDNVWWDADGDPYGGTASSGAYTTIASDGDFWVGTLVTAVTATSGSAKIALNLANPSLPAFVNRIHETHADNYTIDAEDDGKVLHIATDAKAFTLPATAAGIRVAFVNDGADGGVLLSISPNAADKIMGPDIAGTDDKDLLNTKATAIHGDWVELVADGSNGWYVVGMRGIWATEG